MNRQRALARLPRAYTHALRLRDAGFDDAGIARHLEIPLEAVVPLLAIAEAKLARLVETDDRGKTDGAPQT